MLIPLTKCNDIEFECVMEYRAENFCSICNEGCLEGMNNLKCDICFGHLHAECRYEDPDAYNVIKDNKMLVTCSDKCDFSIMPFAKHKFGTLVREGIFSAPKPCRNNVRPLYEKNNSVPSHKKQSKFVKFDKFLDINCSYLDPNNVNDSLYGDKSSDLSVFHCNVRTLNNFDSVIETFRNCKELPDILALTETRLKDGKQIHDLEGYSFESNDSPSAAGGASVYISKSIDYSVRKDLSLNVSHCEDMWMNIEVKNGKKFVIGVIYRHPGHQY